MMREKRRYLQFQLISQKRLSEEDAKHLVYEAVFQLVGEQGASEAALQLKAFDGGKQLLLLKCASKAHQKVIAALALKTIFRGGKVALRLQRIYGTLMKAKAIFPALGQSKV
ncbi:MAG: Rpp14/Pop5 family protein [Candidatus Micrarchaeota archaeon]